MGTLQQEAKEREEKENKQEQAEEKQEKKEEEKEPELQEVTKQTVPEQQQEPELKSAPALAPAPESEPVLDRQAQAEEKKKEVDNLFMYKSAIIGQELDDLIQAQQALAEQEADPFHFIKQVPSWCACFRYYFKQTYVPRIPGTGGETKDWSRQFAWFSWYGAFDSKNYRSGAQSGKACACCRTISAY